MPTIATTIRWDEDSYAWVRAEARDAGMTVAQFVREAAIIRAAVRVGRREAPGIPLDIARVAEECERRARMRRGD